MNWTNIIVGALQVLIPTFLTVAINQDWLPANAVTEWGAIIATVASAGHSAVTTTVSPAGK
jgi:hypothetical protein